MRSHEIRRWGAAFVVLYRNHGRNVGGICGAAPKSAQEGGNQTNVESDLSELVTSAAICRTCCPPAAGIYPLTLIFANDNTARDEIGLPMLMAGRKVVKISMRLT